MDRAGTFIVYPTNASEPVEHFAAEAQGDWRQQVCLFDNRKVSEAFIERSVASGAKALMLTLDCPGYRRDFGFRNGIDGTWEGASGNFPNMHMTDWALNLATSITPKDIQWLKEISGLPVYVKGVMRPEDAVTAMNAGAAGVMVSNHGRRQVDGVVLWRMRCPEYAARSGAMPKFSLIPVSAPAVTSSAHLRLGRTRSVWGVPFSGPQLPGERTASRK